MWLPRAVVLDPSDNGPGLARSLLRRGVSVSLLATHGYAWTSYTRGVDGRVLGSLTQDGEAWLRVLDDLAASGDGVLITASDAASEFVTRERSRIPSRLRSFEAPESAHARLMNKASLYALADQAGVRYPETVLIKSHADVRTAASAIPFPCLLKPTLSHRWRSLFGDTRVIPVRGPRELRALALPAIDAGLELLLCEHIPGPVSDIETAVILRKPGGDVVLEYTKRKLREFPVFGAGTLHETVPAPQTMALALRLLEAADFVGLASVETKRHAETGDTVLIEVNVRVPQGFGLGDAAGVEGAWRLYAALAGLDLPPQAEPLNGTRLVVATRELRWLGHLAASRSLDRATIVPLIKSYRGVRDVSGLTMREPRLVSAFIGDALRRCVRYARPLAADPLGTSP